MVSPAKDEQLSAELVWRAATCGIRSLSDRAEDANPAEHDRCLNCDDTADDGSFTIVEHSCVRPHSVAVDNSEAQIVDTR